MSKKIQTRIISPDNTQQRSAPIPPAASRPMNEGAPIPPAAVRPNTATTAQPSQGTGGQSGGNASGGGSK
jgi:hypothetical protein